MVLLKLDRLSGYRDLEDFLREQYSKLFNLPRKLLLISAYFASITIISILSYTQSGRIENLFSVLGSSILYLLLITIFFNNLEDNSMGLKRILGVAVFSILPYTLLSWIPYMLHKPVYSVFSLSSAMIFLIRYIFWEGIVSSIVIALIIGSLAGFIASASFSIEVLLSLASLSFLSILIMLLFVVFIEAIGRSSGLKAFKLGRGFIRSWIFDDNRYIEEALLEDSKPEDIEIKTLILEGDENRILLIHPGFHFGPFRRVGSSDAVYVFDQELRDIGSTLVFHTTGTHDRNIVKREFVETIAQQYKKEIMRTLRESSREERISVGRDDGRDGWGVYRIGSDRCLSLMIYNREGADDLPRELEEDISKSFEEEILVGVVDTHSMYGRKIHDLESLRTLLIESIRRHLNDSRSFFRVGYGESHMRNLCGGVCSGLVKALVIETDHGRDVVVYIYGNNMIISSNERIVEELKRRGFRDVLIVTPDDHSCAAVSTGDPYTAVKLCSELVNAINEAVDIALRRMSKGRIACSKHVFREIPVMGSTVWSYIKGLERLGPLTPRLWLLFLIASVTPILVI